MERLTVTRQLVASKSRSECQTATQYFMQTPYILWCERGGEEMWMIANEFFLRSLCWYRRSGLSLLHEWIKTVQSVWQGTNSSDDSFFIVLSIFPLLSQNISVNCPQRAQNNV